MDERQALDAFAALAQGTRLAMLRALVRAGPGGLAAGAVAAAVGVPPSNASFHLAHLERAGLVASRRAARCIVYAADYPALSALIGFLMRDCCSGRPEVCAPVMDALACDCADAGIGAPVLAQPRPPSGARP